MAAASAVLFIINNLARTALRHREISRRELTLAFFVTLLGAVALIIDNRSDAQLSFLEEAMFLLIIPMIIIHIGLTVVELARPQRLRRSRGIFGIGIAILLLIANLSYSFIALQAELNAVEQNIRPTPVNSLSQRDPCDVAFESIFRNIIVDITTDIGLEFDELLARVEADPTISIADLVEANGGSADEFISDATTDVITAIRDLLARGCIEPGQATAIIIGAPALVNQFLRSDFQSLLEMANQGGGDEEASLIELSEADIAATNDAFRSFIEQRPSPLPSITPTYTPSRTPTATVTRTPRPTDSPTPTRERFSTATPTLTATLPNPCLATANFNVNLRDYPDLEASNVLLTIPYEASFPIYAPNEEQTWWYGQYEGEAGWISSEYIRLASNCYELPPRRPATRRSGNP